MISMAFFWFVFCFVFFYLSLSLPFALFVFILLHLACFSNIVRWLDCHIVFSVFYIFGLYILSLRSAIIYRLLFYVFIFINSSCSFSFFLLRSTVVFLFSFAKRNAKLLSRRVSFIVKCLSVCGYIFAKIKLSVFMISFQCST